MARLTLEDVAHAAGVSASTVSAALRNAPGVSARKAQEIRNIAASLGYHLDAAASLMARRRGRGDSARRLNVVLLSEDPSVFPLFQEAAREKGLDLETVDPSRETDPPRVARTLWARGCQGICFDFGILSPVWRNSLLSDPCWQRFALVKLSRAFPELRIDLVRHNAFDYMDVALREIFARGFRRIAVLLYLSGHEGDDGARIGSVLHFRACRLPPGTRLFLKRVPRYSPYPFSNGEDTWLRRVRPDAVLSLYWATLYALREAGWRVPDDLAFATVLGMPHKDPDLPPVSGCDIRQTERIYQALALLMDRLHHRQSGFPEHPNERIIDPIWMEGKTLTTSVQKP